MISLYTKAILKMENNMEMADGSPVKDNPTKVSSSLIQVNSYKAKNQVKELTILRPKSDISEISKMGNQMEKDN